MQAKSDYEPKLIARKDLPLLGKRVFFTTPRNYAEGLAALLVQRGARPVWAPTIQIWPMDDPAEIDAALGTIASYDWIAFTSTNGIEALCQRLQDTGRSPAELQKTKLGALGSDAAALEGFGLKVDLRAKVGDPDGLLEEMVKRGISGKRVLVPVPRVIGVPEPYVVPEFIANLKKAGATTQRLDAYQTIAVEAAALGPELRMLENGEVDVVVFTSSAEQLNLLRLLNNRKEVINRPAVAYMGGFSAKTGKDRGLDVDIVPESKFYSMKNLVTAMELHFSTGKRE